MTKKEIIIFDPSLTEIKKRFKYDLNYGLEKVEKFVSKVSDAFKPIFHISPDPEEIKRHPLFKQMHEELEHLVPSITFDESEGKIDRWNIRHVIFRVETIIQIIDAIEDTNKLTKIGENIGKSAAKDLFDNVIENKESMCVPDSLASFISLFDYWDRTGGWGKIILDEFSSPQSKNGEWIIVTHNNFLAQSDSDKTHKLCHFWCGYFKGILNYSLPRLTYIISELEPEIRKKISMPQFIEVADVIHKSDKNIIEDKFIVRFSPQKYSHLLQLLGDAKSEMRKKEEGFELRVFGFCHSIIYTFYKQHENQFYTQLNKMGELDKSIMQSFVDSGWLNFRHDNAENVLDATNLLLQSFVYGE